MSLYADTLTRRNQSRSSLIQARLAEAVTTTPPRHRRPHAAHGPPVRAWPLSTVPLARSGRGPRIVPPTRRVSRGATPCFAASAGRGRTCRRGCLAIRTVGQWPRTGGSLTPRPAADKLKVRGIRADACRQAARRGGRVAECTGLLNRHTFVRAYRGFESRPLRSHTALADAAAHNLAARLSRNHI